MKKYRWIIICIIILAFRSVVADVPATTGIVPGQIWYSEDPLVEGDTVNVYTALWNGATTDLSARVEFYDQNVILGARDVVVAPQSLKDVSVSWKVTSGDHTIHATIVSSSVTTAGKKNDVTLDRNSTAPDHTFVPVVVKTQSGTEVKTADVISDEVQKVTSQVKDAVPESLTNNLGSLDTLRASTYNQITTNKAVVQKQIDTLNATTPPKSTAVNSKNKTMTPAASPSTSAVQKPIAYLKLFFFSVLSFIFGYKIVFYSLLVFLIFIILRFIYRKIRNR